MRNNFSLRSKVPLSYHFLKLRQVYRLKVLQAGELLIEILSEGQQGFGLNDHLGESLLLHHLLSVEVELCTS